MRICAIHQPNFFPWLGYFDKINRADVFVFLDNVDYPKSSKTMCCWSNRVAVLVQGKSCWISVPVIREEGRQKICNVLIDDSFPWRNKILKTIQYNYKKSPHYKDVYPFIEELINYRTEKISIYNQYIIMAICKRLGIGSDFLVQSDVDTEEVSTRLLIELVDKSECDTYMCGGGASGYQEDELFEKANIKLIYQNFSHPVYQQFDQVEMVKGLSILDALFWCGFEGTHKLLK